MAAIFCIEVETDLNPDATGYLDERALLKRCIDSINRVRSGRGAAGDKVRLTKSAVRASGTLTLSSGSGTVGGTIAGTAVTVTWATSDTASAAALAAAINADATVNKLVSASSAAGVVTIKALAAGVQGNKLTLVASGTGCTASGATLANGAGSITDYSR